MVVATPIRAQSQTANKSTADRRPSLISPITNWTPRLHAIAHLSLSIILPTHLETYCQILYSLVCYPKSNYSKLCRIHITWTWFHLSFVLPAAPGLGFLQDCDDDVFTWGSSSQADAQASNISSSNAFVLGISRRFTFNTGLIICPEVSEDKIAQIVGRLRRV